MTATMVRRVAAAQACIDRFNGKSYSPSSNRDCIKLTLHSMRKLGRSTGLLKGKRYTSEAGGVKVMRSLGFRSLIEAMDAAGLERIAPAAALPGDIIALETEADSPFGCALTVAVGNGRVIGFSVGIGQVMQPLAYLTAWRV